MISFSSRAVSAKLKNNEISSKEKMQYFIAVICGFDALYTISVLGGARENLLGFGIAEGVVSFGFSLFGTYYLYKVNSSSGGSSFIDKVICLTVPVGVRIVLLGIVLFGGLSILFENFEWLKDVYNYRVTEFVLFLVVTGCYYWRMAVWMRV